MNKQNGRIFYYDFLRAIAIIGIVSCHVAINFVVNPSTMNTLGWYFAVVIDCFRDFSIPIFVMLTGALLLNKDYSLSNFIKKRFNRVFVPYLFWLCIFILFSYFYISKNISLNTVYNIAMGHNGTIGVVLWFVWMILVIYIAIFIINKIIFYIKNKYSNLDYNGSECESEFEFKSECESKCNYIVKNFDIVLIKSLVCLFLVYLVIIKLTNFNPTPNRLIYYLSFIGYAVLGYYLAHTNFTKGRIVEYFKFTPTKILIVSGIIAIVSYVYYLTQVVALSNKSGHFGSFSYFTFIILILSVSIFLFFRYFEQSDNKSIQKVYSSIKDGFIGKLINSLSKSSYGIYLVHYIVIKYLYVLVLFSINYNSKNPVIALPLLLIVVLGLSWIIVLILSKIPYLNRISGSG